MQIYFLAFFLLVTLSSSSIFTGCQPDHKSAIYGTAKIVFKSTDGGQTWQDISKGLPENSGIDTLRGNSYFSNDKGLFLKVGKELYHHSTNSTAAYWTKEALAEADSSTTAGKPVIFYWSINLKKTDGTSVWSPIFKNFDEPRIRSVFETAGGAIFVGTNRGFFKTVNNGSTWKHVDAGSLVGHLAESDGVLLATSMRKIIRSTDNGENWAVVSSEGVVAFDVKRINGGFAAITASSEKGTRSLMTSFDDGKTWRPIDASPEDKVLNDSIWRTWNNRPSLQASMASIIQVGQKLFCTHPDGIFKSSDQGKTWELVLPSVKDKSFSLFVSGNVIYAIPTKGGC